MTNLLLVGTIINVAASFCVVMSLISNFYATVGGVVGDKLRRISSTGKWRVRRCPELQESEVEVWTNQTNGEVWFHILDNGSNQKYWYNEKTKQRSLETPIEMHSEVLAMMDNRLELLYMLFTTVTCVWMGVTFVGTLYGTHPPSYQYKLDVVRYTLPLQGALIALAAMLLATRINLKKYFPEAQSPVNTYEVFSTLRFMLFLSPFLSLRKYFLKVKYRGDLRGQGTRNLRDDYLRQERELQKIKEGPSWEADPVLKRRAQHLDFSLSNMNQLLGDLEMENALKIMRIWGLTHPVDVCVAAAHLVIRQEAYHFCKLNKRPVVKDNALAALAGAITATPFLDNRKLGEITAELDRLTNTFQKLDSWITTETERLERLERKGVARGQDGTGQDNKDNDDLETGIGVLGSKKKRVDEESSYEIGAAAAGAADAAASAVGAAFLAASKVVSKGGMASIKKAIANKKIYITYLDQLIDEKEQLKSR